jgi:hypothetical protein
MDRNVAVNLFYVLEELLTWRGIHIHKKQITYWSYGE